MQTQVILYHKTIDELPRTKFIDCDVDNNLASLIIGAVPDGDVLKDLWPELNKAWTNILSQYGERVGSNEYKMYVQLYREISLLRITLNQINIIAGREKKDPDGNITQQAGILRLYFVEESAKELNALLKTTCRFNHLHPKSYHTELDKCINRSKAIKIQLDLKLLTFQAMEKKQNAKEGEKTSRQYYEQIFVTLSDHVKYNLPEDIKMGQYCERLNRFIQACEKANK